MFRRADRWARRAGARPPRCARGRARAASLVLAPLLILGWASPLAAEVVELIDIQGNEFISDEAFLALTDVEPGDSYDEAALLREFWKVWDSGLFDDLRIESAAGDHGGRVVIFTVREKPRVDSVSYEKTKAVSESRIEEVLRGNDALISPNQALDQERISRARRILEELLASEGHPDARVTVLQRSVARSRVALDFRIDPGPKVKVDRIVFEGNTVFTDRQLKAELVNTRERGLRTLISDKDVFYRPRFQEDLEAIRRAYRTRGYLDVEIGEPLLRDARPGKSGPEQRRLVTLVVPITEGSAYRLGSLTVSGNSVFDTTELRGLIPLAEGEVCNDRLLRLGITRIDNRYGDEGYLYSVTSPRYTTDPERGLVDVDVQVTENERFSVRRIAFDGNTQTRDHVLRREMRMQEGDVFSRSDFLVSLRKIAQLGFWELSGEPRIEPVEGTNEVDITIAGQEVGRNEIQFGGGFSGVDGLFATFSFSSRNFLGRGSQLSVSGQLGGETTRYSLSYVEPYFMRTRSTVGGSLFAREQDFTSFDRDGKGATVFWSHPTSTFSAFRLTAAWENSEVIGTAAGVEDDEFTTYSLTPAFTFDSRDNPFRPTRGRRLTTSLELGAATDERPRQPEADQGTINFVKPRLGFTQYWRTARRQYAGIHVEGGLLEPVTSGGVDLVPSDMIEPPYLPVFERFFLGGERSIRGVETRSVGPRLRHFGDRGGGEEELADLAIGGDQYYLVNLEYTFPLSSLFEVTGFLDMGNTYGVSNLDLVDLVAAVDADRLEVVDSDPFDVKATAGVELRFHTPVLQQPLRLIYGCKVFGDFFDDEGNCDFQFSIGRTFQ